MEAMKLYISKIYMKNIYEDIHRYDNANLLISIFRNRPEQ